MRRAMVTILFVCALLLAGNASAWGVLGHRLVARLAERQLSPDAEAEVRRLLATAGHASLADVANWADDVRKNDPDLGRRSAPWHFVNLGDHGCSYVARRDCPDGDCVVEAIDTQARILADRTRSDRERLQALKFVVHFVGDVHQPFHAGHTRDRGGNRVQVNHRGRGTNLHSLWDRDLLASRGLGETGYYWKLRGLRADPAPATVAASAAAWAEESCRILQQPGVYPASARIDDAYIARHRPVAEQALVRAGDRLATLLNTTLRD